MQYKNIYNSKPHSLGCVLHKNSYLNLNLSDAHYLLELLLVGHEKSTRKSDCNGLVRDYFPSLFIFV